MRIFDWKFARKGVAALLAGMLASVAPAQACTNILMIAADEPVRQLLESLSDEQARAFLRCIEESLFGGLLVRPVVVTALLLLVLGCEERSQPSARAFSSASAP